MSEGEKRVIAVDLDGTLAYYDGWRGIEHIGAPIPEMVERIERWLSAGIEVRIFTARAHEAAAIAPIREWLVQHLGRLLPITNVKAPDMTEFWDDRAVSVHKNTGRAMSYFHTFQVP